MADVRLASYADLQLEIQARERSDTTLSQRIEAVSESATGGIENLQEAAESLNGRVGTAETGIIELETNKLKRHIVQELPSDSVKYTFNDGVSRFTNDYRTACYVSVDEKGGFYQTIINNGNSNTYRRAFFDCSDIMSDATRMVVEFDFMLSERWHIGLADLSQRPGGSTGSQYTSVGVAFYMGTADGSRLNINGTRTNVSIADVWLSAKIVLDFQQKIVAYTITNRETGVIETSGTAPFKDTSVTAITGIEAYTWYTGMMTVDNLSITSSYDAQDNVIYLVPVDNNTYLSYVYVDDKPMLIGNSSLKKYSATPHRIGTWIDGRPVWRVDFLNRPIPYNEEEPTLYEDQSYTPFYDYERNYRKYVKSINGVLVLEGLMQLEVGNVSCIGVHWNEQEYSFQISQFTEFQQHETLYFSGYVEFVTPYDNILEG